MQLTISSIDYAPGELYDQVPIVADLLREMPGDDRPDYWLAKTRKPIRWLRDNIGHEVSYLVLAARWDGTAIEPGVEHLPVGIGYVTDETLLEDDRMTPGKCEYVAVGISSETSGGKAAPELKSILAGRIGRAFGLGPTGSTEQGDAGSAGPPQG